MLVLGYAAIAAFFLRFWRDTRDRLFFLFACAFAILGAQRALIALTAAGTTGPLWLYGLRLFAFLLILAAIADKNRR
jgi:hypothetical protein